MSVNESIDWSKGEINISPENIQVKSLSCTYITLSLQKYPFLDTLAFFYYHHNFSFCGCQMSSSTILSSSANQRFSTRSQLWKSSKIRWCIIKSGMLNVERVNVHSCLFLTLTQKFLKVEKCFVWFRNQGKVVVVTNDSHLRSFF